jgi:hypothetical protein
MTPRLFESRSAPAQLVKRMKTEFPARYVNGTRISVRLATPFRTAGAFPPLIGPVRQSRTACGRNELPAVVQSRTKIRSGRQSRINLSKGRKSGRKTQTPSPPVCPLQSIPAAYRERGGGSRRAPEVADAPPERHPGRRTGLPGAYCEVVISAACSR